MDVVKNAELGCCKLCPFSISGQFLFCFDFPPLRVFLIPRHPRQLWEGQGSACPVGEMTHSFSHSYLAKGTSAQPCTVTPHPQLPSGPACQWPPLLTQFLAWLPQRAGTLEKGQKGLGRGARGGGRSRVQPATIAVCLPQGPRFLRMSLSRTAYDPAPQETKIAPIRV